MAVDQSNKRKNIATNTVIAATSLWDAVTALNELKLERAQAGDFVDADFTGGDLAHISPFLIGAFLDSVVTDLNTWFTDPAHPERRDYTIQLRR